jgi:thiol-disulfide isomerase/thioredoxin
MGCVVFFAGNAVNDVLMHDGAPVPALEVRRLDNTTFPLSAFVGRPLVINLWATWCPPCRREMPVLQAAQRTHPAINFVFVNQGESEATVQSYLDTNGLQMSNIVLDPAKQVSARTGSSGYPTTLFYDAKGRLYKRHMGELSQATLTEMIDGFMVSR